MTSSINEAQLGRLQTELRDGRKLMAVKLYREWTGASLAEAKRAIESMAADHLEDPRVFDEELDSETIDQVLDAIQKRNKLLAVKIYRDSRGVSLLEAKTFVERLMKELDIEDKPATGCVGVVLLFGLALVEITMLSRLYFYSP